VRRAARRIDTVAERVARTILRRRLRDGRPIYAGAFSRLLALAIDGGVVYGSLLLISASIAFLISIFQSGDQEAGAVVLTLGFIAWSLIAIAYLVVFWSGAGRPRTPRLARPPCAHGGLLRRPGARQGPRLRFDLRVTPGGQGRRCRSRRKDREMVRLIAIGAAAGALALVGCGGDDDGGGDSTAPAGGAAAGTSTEAQPAPAESGGSGTTVQVSSSDYGQILFDGENQAIYLFEKESRPTSECYGECATAWPPVVTKGEPQVGKGADASLLGTTKRNDGTTQVTYNGHPLYYYEEDGPGEVLCQNVNEFGGLWLVVDAKGEAVQ
jgi:predicted lipoprotein with Yx(FWY)xxD motif